MTVIEPQTDRAAEPIRRSIATFRSYPEAQAAVDRLADRRFPVEHVAIVATDLRFVEQVAGRLTAARAAVAGSGQGALFGAVTGLFLGLLFAGDNITEPWALTLWGLMIGALLGGLLGAVSHAATSGRRDFTSVGRMEAERYEVMVDDEQAQNAFDVLQAPGSQTA